MKFAFARMTALFYRVYARVTGDVIVTGISNIPKTGPCIVVANHIAIDDPWYITSAFPFMTRMRWVAKIELVEYKKILHTNNTKNWLLRHMIALYTVVLVKYSAPILVDRDNKGSRTNRVAIKEMVETLKEGDFIGIFPEGGIGRHGQVKSLFVSIARKNEAMILPVSITDTTINIGEPILPNEMGGDPDIFAKTIMKNIYENRV